MAIGAPLLRPTAAAGRRRLKRHDDFLRREMAAVAEIPGASDRPEHPAQHLQLPWKWKWKLVCSDVFQGFSKPSQRDLIICFVSVFFW